MELLELLSPVIQSLDVLPNLVGFRKARARDLGSSVTFQ